MGNDNSVQNATKYIESEDNTGSFIELNVGGMSYVTTRATLRKVQTPMLQFASPLGSPSQESASQPDLKILPDIFEDGKKPIRIDRDGPSFRFVLNFLRNEGDVSVVPDGLDDLRLLRVEANFFGLRDLAKACDAREKDILARKEHFFQNGLKEAKAIASRQEKELNVISKKLDKIDASNTSLNRVARELQDIRLKMDTVIGHLNGPPKP